VTDPFEILGVEPRFELDLTDVEMRHREMSRVLHPDKHVGGPASERRQALSRAIEVNQALSVLKDPVQRAEALLRHYGVTVIEGREAPADPMLLMDLLELGESISDARRARDRARLEAGSRDLSSREQHALEELKAGFRELERERAAGIGDTREAADRVLKEIGVLRFTRRLVNEAALAREELES
jgi:molecular chaperone HscB